MVDGTLSYSERTALFLKSHTGKSIWLPEWDRDGQKAGNKTNMEDAFNHSEPISETTVKVMQQSKLQKQFHSN